MRCTKYFDILNHLGVILTQSYYSHNVCICTKMVLQLLVNIKHVIFTQTRLHYLRVFAIVNPSVVCNVLAPYSGG